MPGTPIGPFVSSIQLFRISVTRTPKKAVVIARKCPRRRRTIFPMTNDSSPATAPAHQIVTQKGSPDFRLISAEAYAPTP